jgi:hypothetical protein
MTIPDPAEVQRYAEEVLRRPEFHAATAQQPDRLPWLARLLAALAALRMPVFHGLGVVELFAIGVAAAVVAVLAVHLVRLVRSGRLRLAPRAMPPAEAAAPGVEAAATPLAALAAADGALAAGDARAAVQALLHACLLFLAGLGAIVLARWKTTTAYLAECPPAIGPLPLFRDLAAAHNDIVYAHRAVAPDRIAALRDELGRRVGSP